MFRFLIAIAIVGVSLAATRHDDKDSLFKDVVVLNIQYTCSSGCCLDMKVMDQANGGSICYSFFSALSFSFAEMARGDAEKN